MNNLIGIKISLLLFLLTIWNNQFGYAAMYKRQNEKIGHEQVNHYLMDFGYLPKSDIETGNLRTESQWKEAIKNLQRFGNIPETGEIDEETRRLIKRPRCGVSDQPNTLDFSSDNRRYSNSTTRVKRFVLQGPKWKHTNLTWSFVNRTMTELDVGQVRRTLSEALSIWQKNSKLIFREVYSELADIQVLFARGHHGDGYNFDGPGLILAHAFYPGEGRGGDAHFDADEKWTMGSSDDEEGADLMGVAVHEFGHSLGLGHSSVEGAVMYPWYKGYDQDKDLPEDDRRGIQYLYPSREKQWGANPHRPPQRPPQPTTTTTTTTTTTQRPLTFKPRIVTSSYDPRKDDPRYKNPRYNPGYPYNNDPRYNHPRYNDPRYNDPRYNDPRYNDPRNDNPRRKDDPRLNENNSTPKYDPRYDTQPKNDPRFNENYPTPKHNDLPRRDNPRTNQNHPTQRHDQHHHNHHHHHQNHLTTTRQPVRYPVTEGPERNPRPTHGPPRKYPSTKSPRKFLTNKSEKPDGCDMSFDAITMIRGELFVFKDKYLWRVGDRGLYPGYPHETIRLWNQLPTNFTHIDAVYENRDRKIVFFIGKDYYVFNSNVLEQGYPKPISNLGLPPDLTGIDAALIWGHNNKTYFYSKTLYWRFDEDVGKVELDYPRDMSIWQGIGYHINTGFQYTNGKTYFFKGKNYWEFDDNRMGVAHSHAKPNRKWLHCPRANENDRRQYRIEQNLPLKASASDKLSYNVLNFILFLLLPLLMSY